MQVQCDAGTGTETENLKLKDMGKPPRPFLFGVLAT